MTVRCRGLRFSDRTLLYLCMPEYQLLGRIVVLRRCGLLLRTEQLGLSVGLSVTIVSPAKTAEPIEMPFGV